MTRLPAIPTLLVALAVSAMIALGVWQLDRADQKEALLARYAAAAGQPPMSWPTMPTSAARQPLFRHATGNCLSVAAFRTAPGANADGDSGYLVIAECRTGAEGPGMPVELGWSKNPNAGRDWRGGLVSGTIAPDKGGGMRLHAATPAPGLLASRPPSPETIANNHRSYAMQWFLFAAAALIIYGLALRRRWRDKPAG